MSQIKNNNFKIVLINPEIPGNTGTIGRTCVALEIELILIGTLGFSLDEKSVRRAGLDYWKFAKIIHYISFEEFILKESPEKEQLFFFENHKTNTIYDAKFIDQSYLIFGSETKGIPQSVLDSYKNNIYSIPMLSDKIRSLNLSNAASIVTFECLRQLNFAK